ncbi:MAG TPA: hypothetical protein VMB21_17900 [Candidatus Limnocylindria bacterium]|nr:hypothetical protein [Candidatus Limnocylindria bacterium]
MVRPRDYDGRTMFPRSLISLLPLVTATAFAQQAGQPAGAPLPAGYQLVYEQHFDSADALRGFAMTDPAAWKFATDGGAFALELADQSKYEPAFRSPFNIALIADRTFGDFVLEADLLQTGKEYGHRDMCLFFGVQDPSHFYYTHIATKGDDHAHNVFIVNGAPRLKFAKQTTVGVDWGTNAWHHVRLERRVGEGSVRVFFDDMTTPIMLAEDKTFGAGYVGFGSFDDTGKVDNIRIWSPNPPATKPTTFYKRPSP